MPRFIITAVALLGLILAPNCAPAQTDTGAFEIAFENLEFNRPIYFAAPPTDGNDVFVMNQHGKVYKFPNKRNVTEDQQKLVLDIHEKVQSPQDSGHNEEGLLGMAFHPDFANNHKVYFDYTAKEGDRRNIISEWQYNPDTGKIDPGSERVLMEIEQPYANHNGGHLAFGPKGYLYITKGDGGSGGDPKENGQDLSTLLGSIFRIDVDNRENGKPYAIPDSNPFVDRENAEPEIYAYGLRNVWRFSFDAETDKLWAGDVGQNAYEEVHTIKKGGNYGWNEREGFHAFEGGEMQPGFINPVHEYPHKVGKSVTGGYVYRGDALPSMKGAYIFGDYASSMIWAMRYDHRDKPGEDEVTKHRRIGIVPSPASFGVDRENEVYICSFDGHIYKMTSNP